MNTVVVDASVAAKWMLPSALEPYSEMALRLLDDHRTGRFSIVVPDLFWTEIGNVLSKSVRSGRVSLADAQVGLNNIKRNEFATASSLPLLDAALEIATSLRRSFYDCLYVALAQSRQIEFVTADEKLVNALGTRYAVRWLGAMS